VLYRRISKGKEKSDMAKKPKGTSKPRQEARWSKNTAAATEKAKKAAGRLSEKERKQIAAEGKKHAKEKRARIRDVGQEVPPAYARTGKRYFPRVENYRPDATRNSPERQSFANAPLEYFQRADGWIHSASKQGMLDKDGGLNLRKTTSARNKLAQAGLYGKDAFKERAGMQTRRKESNAIIYWGQDGKAP
jgi:hypothetical protein